MFPYKAEAHFFLSKGRKKRQADFFSASLPPLLDNLGLKKKINFFFFFCSEDHIQRSRDRKKKESKNKELQRDQDVKNTRTEHR